MLVLRKAEDCETYFYYYVNIPNKPLPGPWEACFTLGTQWLYNNHKWPNPLVVQLDGVTFE
jgi:hypothetical protein